MINLALALQNLLSEITVLGNQACGSKDFVGDTQESKETYDYKLTQKEDRKSSSLESHRSYSCEQYKTVT